MFSWFVVRVAVVYPIQFRLQGKNYASLSSKRLKFVVVISELSFFYSVHFAVGRLGLNFLIKSYQRL